MTCRVDGKGSEQLPIDVEAIADEIGIRVYQADFRNNGLVPALVNESGYSESELEYKGITSQSYRDEDGMVTAEEDFSVVYVFLHSDLSHERRRWVCAHELGHYLLGHLPWESAGDLKDRLREAGANWVAAQLLMPESLVRQAVADTGLDCPRLANMFGVGPEWIRRRLCELGMIDQVDPESRPASAWDEYCIYPW